MQGVHVWRASLERSSDEVARLYELLDAPERARAAGFIHQRDRRRFVVGRATLRTLLADYTGTSPAAVRLYAPPGGKPVLMRDAGSPEVHFNLSHCDELALFAFADREIGIDVERLRPESDMPRVAGHFFSPEESVAFRRLDGSQQTRFFYRTWVRKEAYLKAKGDGFAIDPALIRIADPPARDVTLVDKRGNCRVDGTYSVHDIVDVRGYVAALAIAGSADASGQLRAVSFFYS